MADDRPNWRPDRFAYDVWGCGLDFHFPVIKLLDFAGREAVLEASDNPFALITRAHLATMQTRHDPESRHAGKIRLVRELYDRGMSRDDVLQLFRIIDWMMDLPKALGQLFEQEVERIEQERAVPYVTSIERHAEQRGQVRMLLRALERQYRVTVPEEMAARIRETDDLEIIERWLDLAYAVDTFEEFQQQMQSVQEKAQPYVTSIERHARADMLIHAVERQFRVTMPDELAIRIHETKDVAILERWFDLVFETKSFEEFQQRMGSATE